ncbi:DUF2891 family protein [bacterium]|nr:DUF2891 family protein [bacterium]
MHRRSDHRRAAGRLAAELHTWADDGDAPLAFEPSGQDFLSPIMAEADPRRAVVMTAQRAHARDGLAAVTGEHYAGGHWLGTYAIYLLTSFGETGVLSR